MISCSHWGLFPLSQKSMSAAWYQALRDGTAWASNFGR
ncbi:hypothetical protein ACVL5V_005544 [Bradyrhizobium ottawaense]